MDFLQVQFTGAKIKPYEIIVKQKRFDSFRNEYRLKECRGLAQTQGDAIKYISNRFSGGK